MIDMEFNDIIAKLPTPYYRDEQADIVIYCADCRDILPLIPDKSIDLVLTDPPYGITACEWDIIPDLDRLWAELKRVGGDNCAYVFTTNQPFTTDLINSNRKWFRYEIIWDRVTGKNPYLAKKMPMKSHDNILIFYRSQPTYNPQMIKAEKGNMRDRVKNNTKARENTIYGNIKEYTSKKDENLRYPTSVFRYSYQNDEVHYTKRQHPTQKPSELFKYLIETYSNPRCLILDPFLGSGTTAYCAKKLNRKCIGIEIEEKYCEIAAKRLSQSIMKSEV